MSTLKTTLRLLSLLPLLCLSRAAASEFFVMDNGLRDIKTLADKAALLGELGYDGVTWRPGNTAEAAREMSARDVKVHALMMNLPVRKEQQAASHPLDDIEALKGTGAILWVQLTRKGGDDTDAVRELRRLSAVAKPLGLRIAIYPHVNNHVESLEEALRVADLVADDNVGVSLTLCHQLKIQGVQNLTPLLKKALPKLFLVLVSGADTGDTKAMGWNKLIQPLGQGSYDVGSLLETLQELDYQGPVGVIGFGLKQPANEHLKQSIDFWRTISVPASGATGSRQSKNPALVFLIAGQSNAGGVAAFSPETNEKSGMAKKHPTIPGSTAKEVGIPLAKKGYPRSWFWKDKTFVPLAPGSGYYTSPYPKDPNRHGIELPMAMLLEKRYPDADKFFIKHGPGGHNLHTQWKADSGPDYKKFKGQLDGALADLNKRYQNVRLIGLYWDQGESDRPKANEYGKNLRALFAAFRKDTGIPDLPIFVRKHLFQRDDESFAPILEAQVEVTREDPHAHLLDLDLGSNEKNFRAWSWADNNGHLSSKAFLELAGRILALKGTVSLENAVDTWGPFVGPWERYEKNPIIRLEGNETYSIQNGPQSVIRWKDKWYMFLMTSQPMVTKLAVSDDGLVWMRPHHDYLLKPEMKWEGSYNLAKAAVIRDDEVWLYYFGKKEKTEMIALARSKDLINWNKQPQPIFTHEDSRIDGSRAFPDCVIKEGDVWYMYYDVGFDYHHPKDPDAYTIGVAQSKDGINWTDSSKSPVLTTSDRTADSWDDGMVSQCSVTKVDEWFYMLYSGSTNNYGRKYAGKNRMAFGLARARHPEGPWEKYPHNPVFKPTGNADDFDGVFLQHACPVKVGDQWRMYYNGWTLNPKAKNSIGAEYAIGLALTNGLTTTTRKKN